ncbi:MAG TPA: fumarylacetoacetate hydrolase family protein [Phycisphaerae bacterium]|nr:fumarylacetoacetate hydrolase family protein [Phycisphaerae bacterium]
MKVIRFEDNNGNILLGEQVDERTARLIKGDLFGDWEVTGGTATIKRLLAPVQPVNVIAIGLNYRRHAAESGAQIPSEPLVFVKLTTSVIGPGDEIVLPASAPEEVDYEAELAVVIGRTARKVSEADALKYVLGYMCANDVSARDCQIRRDKQWARAKGFDTFCPLGPCLLVDPQVNPNSFPIRTRLNGELMQNSNTADMIFPVPFLVSYLSHQFTLLPGTVILTGTPEGVGCARKPPVFLKPGDTVSVELEGIGTLTNPVVADRA